jgi:flagellar biosynthesis/type III secretory pathway protein FliH
MSDERPAHRLDAASVNRGTARRLVAPTEIHASADELDHRLGFDLGYRDGLARATAEAETAAIEARVNWETTAQAQLDAALADLEVARLRLTAAADAMNTARLDERDWAVGLAVEITYAAVVRLLGERHAQGELLGPMCARVVHDVPERPLCLRVAPEDLEAIAPHVNGVNIEVDARLSSGACELDTPRGRVVAGLGERMTLLRDTLVSAIGVASVSADA